ncbi:MAG: hypothetical protein AAGH72_02880 [Verrucomicrobiota bacterium]
MYPILAASLCLMAIIHSVIAEPTISANSTAELTWSAPAGWEKQQAGMMVLESYLQNTPAGELKLSISAFPGDVGGDLANVNRWLRQTGMEAVTKETLPTVLKQELISGREWKIVALANGEDGMFVAYTLSGSKSWFFKITGPTAGIDSVHASFKEFLATVGTK